MRYIKKNKEPDSLSEHRNQKKARYNGYRDTDGLRKALVHEQGAICCYCCSRIYPRSDSMVIEHWKPQSKYPKLELSYSNILGSCTGGKNSDDTDAHHCDKKKKNRELDFSPADPSHMIESKVSYDLMTGEIRSNFPNFNKQLGKVLNLNTGHFKEQRKKAFEAVIAWKGKRNLSRQVINREIDRLSYKGGDLEEFSPVKIWLLREFSKRAH